MAKNAPKDDDNAIELDATVHKGGKGKLILIIVLVVLLVTGTTLGVLYFMGVLGGGGSSKGKDDGAKEQEQTEVLGPATYFELKPEFVVNFEGEQRASYLQVDIQLMTRTPEVVKVLEEHAPLIRNNILLLLSGQKYDELRTLEGKEKMRSEVLKVVQQVVEVEFGKPAVDAVYFTSFIMQ